jgi:pyruvate,orthophosphate dikinase
MGSETTRWVLPFDDADPEDVDLLGGKGAGLARMAGGDLPVPDGYIITTEACRQYLRDSSMPDGLEEQIIDELRVLEQRTGRGFGDAERPLLVSVRSGAPVSMPGMMDTILNLGITRQTAIALGRLTGDARFVADVVVRFHQMFSEIVHGALPGVVDDAVAHVVAGVTPDDDVGDVFDRVWTRCQRAVADDVDRIVPDDPVEQLTSAVEAVFASWNRKRAVTYREHHRIPHDLGTAVVIQTMVFGNLGSPSGTGVAFTRSPIDGSATLYGEYLEGGQGEDVVSGTVDPEPLQTAAARLPDVFAQLRTVCAALESAYRDALDIEYTVERGMLYLLQVRVAKRTPQAAVRIAAELAEAGTITWADALRRVDVEHVRALEQVRFDPDALADAKTNGAILTSGVGASPGQVSGVLVVDPDQAVDRARAGERVILARPTTSPRDVHGMLAADGILTARGGATSHAAVVARALAKACVVGCSDLQVDEQVGAVSVGDRTIHVGEELSLDGSSGEVYVGALATSRPAASNDHLATLLTHADEQTGLTLFARSTTADQITDALRRGADGIVTSVDDVFATSGTFDDAMALLTDQLALDRRDLSAFADTVADQFTPLLRSAGEAPLHVRALDVLADEAREMLKQTELLTTHPALSVPMGVPPLIEAQLRGLARAVSDSGYTGRAALAVRHITDPREAHTLRELAEAEDGAIDVACYLSNPRGTLLAAELGAECGLLWVEVRVLQALVFGLPPRQLLTAEPIDSYRRDQMIDTDPREDLDRSMDVFLESVARAAADGATVGMRLSGPVREGVAHTLVDRGMRLFAVDAGEIGAARLALARAAMA